MHISSARYVSAQLWWLRLCLALVVLMVLIGGLTRLTESGLSIVEWKLLSGIMPPLSDTGWQQSFADYQTTPEFKEKNYRMTVQDFKRIYWLEYIHRLLGRVIGLAFVLPLLYFTIKQAAPPKRLMRYWGIFTLICAQGAVGWYMVKSGLVNEPWVSPYRLAFHLSIATVIMGWLYISIQTLSGNMRPISAKISYIVLAAIMLQIIWGAFVAGLDAGLIYNEFPNMGNSLMPDEVFSGGLTSIFTHHATVQFVHRWLAFIVLGLILWQALKVRRFATGLAAVVALLQMALGITTLLSGVAIPLASAHQMNAMLLILVQLHVCFVDKPLKTSNFSTRKTGKNLL